MRKLTPNSQIPASVRGRVRAIVKAHPAWPAFLAEKSMISADAKNRDLIELALRHPALAMRIEQVIRNVDLEQLLGELAQRSAKGPAQPVLKQLARTVPKQPAKQPAKLTPEERQAQHNADQLHLILDELIGG
jgi:hypothetical protein